MAFLARLAVVGMATTIVLAFSGAGSFSSAEAASTACLPGALQSRLSQIRERFGPIKVISTYRKGARIRGSGKRSYHANCRAVDFIPPAGKYRAVTNWLYANHEGGVGTYTCMNHIHIDNGPTYRWSKCR